ncbi:MAG: hypothetical protein IRY89_07655 [Pseudolabrys sp.]|nr:hypothetical protein [Pseudolabrys sp.]
MPCKPAILALIPLLLAAAPAVAITSKEKMQTCIIGADDQKLEGAKRKTFIAKCMGKGNYEPAARKAALKKNAKPAAQPKANANPPQPEAEPDEEPAAPK